MPAEFKAIFARLRAILQKQAGALNVSEDTPARFCLAGGKHPRSKQPMPVAWVQMGKAYVSYHLMPVYGCPRLLDAISPRLRVRMQGKSCFNFKVSDEALFQELEELTVRGFRAFKQAGFMD